MDAISINIKKPLYGNFVYIRGDFVDRAIRMGAMLDVTIPNGRAIVDPNQWKERAIKTDKVMKKVFKFPDNPMVLYGGYVPLPLPKGEVQKEETTKQAKLF